MLTRGWTFVIDGPHDPTLRRELRARDPKVPRRWSTAPVKDAGRRRIGFLEDKP